MGETMLPATHDPRRSLRLVPRPAIRSRPLVLVAEHDDDTRSMLRTLLTLEGFDVAESDTGDGTLTAASSLQPDVILLDGALPSVDGLAVAQRLRSRRVAGSDRIVFVSADAGRALEERVHAAGCHSFLLKPVDFDQLLQIVRRLAARAVRGG